MTDLMLYHDSKLKTYQIRTVLVFNFFIYSSMLVITISCSLLTNKPSIKSNSPYVWSKTLIQIHREIGTITQRTSQCCQLMHCILGIISRITLGYLISPLITSDLSVINWFLPFTLNWSCHWSIILPSNDFKLSFHCLGVLVQNFKTLNLTKSVLGFTTSKSLNEVMLVTRKIIYKTNMRSVS